MTPCTSTECDHEYQFTLGGSECCGPRDPYTGDRRWHRSLTSRRKLRSLRSLRSHVESTSITEIIDSSHIHSVMSPLQTIELSSAYYWEVREAKALRSAEIEAEKVKRETP